MAQPLAPGSLTATFATFVLSLLVGGLALATGERLVTGTADLRAATVTAALGAVAWVVVDGVPLLGPLLALGLWVAILRWRFDTDWLGTGAIAGIAWLTSLVAVTVGSAVGLPVEEAIGIPAV